MNREELLQEIEKQLNPNRFQHSLRVAETARHLAEKYGADPAQAELASWLHDICKQWDKRDLKMFIESQDQLSLDLLDYSKEIWHGPVGAIVAKDRYNITDDEVLLAVANHTSGRPGMSLLEKIIWIADYIEPGRQFAGLDEVRRLVDISLDKALVRAFSNTIIHLLKKGKQVYPLTFETYNDLLALPREG